MIHNQKNPASVVISVSCSTLARIKQQYNMSTKRATKRKSTMMSVDDSVLTKFQTLLNDIFVNYDNYNLIMNSDTTRIQQSMAPTNVLTFKNKPANVDQRGDGTVGTDMMTYNSKTALHDVTHKIDVCCSVY